LPQIPVLSLDREMLMGAALSTSDYMFLIGEADRAAVSITRRLRLSTADRDDLRQDLLVDLLARVDKFDPRRGTLGAFAGIIIQHRAARIAAHLRRNGARVTTVSIDDPTVGRDDITLLDTCSEDDGYLAWIGSCASPITVLEDRLSMSRALNTLCPEHIGLCAELVAGSIEGGASRATRYRHLHEVRLQLLAAGIGVRT
jgi:DNA-directed RNA polymerase specialized sigma24 family protein